MAPASDKSNTHAIAIVLFDIGGGLAPLTNLEPTARSTKFQPFAPMRGKGCWKKRHGANLN